LGRDPSWRSEITLACVAPFFGRSKSRRLQLLHEIVDAVAWHAGREEILYWHLQHTETKALIGRLRIQRLFATSREGGFMIDMVRRGNGADYPGTVRRGGDR
jgi:hypothetical protein